MLYERKSQLIYIADTYLRYSKTLNLLRRAISLQIPFPQHIARRHTSF